MKTQEVSPITPNSTVGSLVAENPARARVFEKYRIDYCCAGKVELANACARRGADIDVVLRELAECDAGGVKASGEDWTKEPLTKLADHIVDTHHKFLEAELPRLDAMTARVAEVHGTHAPEVAELREVFVAFRAELEGHARKEETILFPWIKKMEQEGSGPMAPGATVGDPIRCMEHEHDDAGAALEKMRELTNGFVPPMDACNTWRVLYASLEALERDMHTHIHKENSILFPRALELEDRIA